MSVSTAELNDALKASYDKLKSAQESTEVQISRSKLECWSSLGLVLKSAVKCRDIENFLLFWFHSGTWLSALVPVASCASGYKFSACTSKQTDNQKLCTPASILGTYVLWKPVTTKGTKDPNCVLQSKSSLFFTAAWDISPFAFLCFAT